MDEADLAWRSHIALRLKAARWLAGGVVYRDGAPKVEALSADDLAKDPHLRANKMTAHKIGSIERMDRHTTPMELGQLAQAFGLPLDYFAPTGTADADGAVARLLGGVLRHARRGEDEDEPGQGTQTGTGG